MSERPTSPLRQRMLEDMTVRWIGEKTRANCIRHAATFTAFLGRSPDTATAEDVRRFQVHLTGTSVSSSSMNQVATALRFFFAVTLGRSELALHLARVHYPRKLLRVLSPEEVGRLLEAAPGPGLKYKAALNIAYGAGLRADEVVMLRVSDVDSKRMLIRVEQGTRCDCGIDQLGRRLIRRWQFALQYRRPDPPKVDFSSESQLSFIKRDLKRPFPMWSGISLEFVSDARSKVPFKVAL